MKMPSLDELIQILIHVVGIQAAVGFWRWVLQ